MQTWVIAITAPQRPWGVEMFRNTLRVCKKKTAFRVQDWTDNMICAWKTGIRHHKGGFHCHRSYCDITYYIKAELYKMCYHSTVGILYVSHFKDISGLLQLSFVFETWNWPVMSLIMPQQCAHNYVKGGYFMSLLILDNKNIFQREIFRNKDLKKATPPQNMSHIPTKF